MSSETPKIERYFSTVINDGLYTNKGNLRFHLSTLFGKIDFENKRVLDIGGGIGLHSFYFAAKGAKEVVCLEPEAEGSTLGVKETFQVLGTRLGLKNVILESTTFQAFESEGKKFDIVLLHNSINHLNEVACINLLNDSESKSIYKDIFLKLSRITTDGAKLIISDCSRYNFFNLFKAKNPFVPTIEWQKHQGPWIWAQQLSEVGFMSPKTKWTSFNSLRSFGKILFGNRTASYFLNSQFCLTMEKSYNITNVS